MDGRIRVLDDGLVDQIAAGEVVERPASVVKELVENALDAGASSIAVEIESGGSERVRVSDDGEGMSPQDAATAVQRHATSKLASAEDLRAIRTLGFRGEALPSIASIARFTLTTRAREAIGGTRVHIEGGGEVEITEVGRAPGTTVDVQELFFNVPARRKFLKKPATESHHVAEACLRAALARPEVKLTLQRDGRRAREYLPTATLVERARAIFPDERLTTLETERDGIRLHGALGAPEKARSGATALHVLVNGRPVRDRSLARAVAFAYGSVLPPGRYPTGVVSIELDPEHIDVNVHPQKAEVRFAEARTVLDRITRMLASQLGTKAWSGPAARGSGYWEQRLARDSGAAPEGAAPTAPAAHGVYESASRYASADSAAHAPAPEPAAPQARAHPAAPSSTADPGSPPGAPASPDANAPESLWTETGFFGALRVLGQVRRMLIVCEGPDGLHVLDQHAADERIRYHRYRTYYRNQHVSTQQLLFPERVELTPPEASIVEESRDALLGLGLDCTLVGPSTAAVHAVPKVVERASPERLLRDVVDELGRHGERAFGDAVDMAIATMACHAAIRAGDALSNEECSALLRSLDDVDEFAGHCPHGRPIIWTTRFDELERALGR